MTVRTQCLWLILFVGMGTDAPVAQEIIDWQVDNLTEIGGFPASTTGDPQVITADGFQAVEFDGDGDGLFVEGNPMVGATAFTIEIILNPYVDGSEAQRFLHFQQDDGNRILMELRMTGSDQWALDTFINSGGSGVTLLDRSLLHPADTWHHAALVFSDGEMRHFVNGEQELSESHSYQAVTEGRSSLGVRLNEVSHFKGAIRHVRVTHGPLTPEQFLSADTNVTALSAASLLFSGHDGGGSPIALATGQIAFGLSESARLRLFDLRGRRLILRQAMSIAR